MPTGETCEEKFDERSALFSLENSLPRQGKLAPADVPVRRMRPMAKTTDFQFQLLLTAQG